MTLYLDTSALVKRYVREAHTEAVSQLVQTHPEVGTAAITYAEVASALARASRQHYLSPQQAQLAWHAFDADWKRFFRVRLREATLQRASALLWQYPLQAYDAIHLACAWTWQESLGQEVVFATFDQTLWQAAQRSGLPTWPANLVIP